MSYHPSKPLCIDLYAGLGGWAEGFLAEGYRVVGFDNGHTAPYAHGARYPGQLVLQDVLTIHGSQFRNATCIVASPPCQNYSYLAMPWSRSVDWARPDGDGWQVLNSADAKAMREKWEREGPDNRLFDACFRIQREAIFATDNGTCRKCGHSRRSHSEDGIGRCERTCAVRCIAYVGTYRHIPLIVENVRGAIPWVGRSAWNFGSFHLWGDVPALMPFSAKKQKNDPRGYEPNSGSWFGVSMSDVRNKRSMTPGAERQKNSIKGIHTDRPTLPDGTGGTSWFGAGKCADPRDVRRNESGEYVAPDGTKIGGDWFSDPNSTCRKHGSRSNARRMASAIIAKIPFELSRHIAATYKPRIEATA